MIDSPFMQAISRAFKIIYDSALLNYRESLNVDQ